MMNKDQERCYNEIKAIMPEILAFVQRGLENYTDHGKGHSERIEKILEKIIKICNSSNNERCMINDTEEYLLLLSAWLHDIGCIISRTNHASKSAEIVQKHFSEVECIVGIIPYLTQIIAAHSDSDDESNRILKIPDEPIFVFNEYVKLRYISALFRLADACDIDMSRCPRMVLKILDPYMDDTSKKFWHGHRDVIPELNFNSTKGSIEISVSNKDTTKLIIDQLKRNFNDVKDILKEYEFPFQRIEIKVIDFVQ